MGWGGYCTLHYPTLLHPNAPHPPPQSWVILGIGFLDLEKMTFLGIVDMYLPVFLYLVNIWSYTVFPAFHIPLSSMSKELL